jgi:hypothetical protein
MIVECFGIPGAGKSTVASLLATEFGFKEVPKQVPKKYWVQFLLQHPNFVCKWFFLLFRESFVERAMSLGRFKLAVFLNTLGRIQYARQNYSKEDLIVLDEGFLQRVFSLFESPQTSHVYDDLLKSIPAAHMVIQIEYNGVKFTESRVGTYRRTKGEEYIKQWRHVMAQNFKKVSESLQRSKFDRILYVRNDEADESLTSIVQAIKEHQANVV